MVKKTVIGSFICAYKYKKQIAQATVIPILLSFLIKWSLVFINDPFLTVALLLPQVVLPAIVAINVHRLVVNGENSIPKWGRLLPGKIELWFIGHSILIFATFLPLVLLSGLGASPVVLLSFLVLIILPLVCRLSIVFPAIAIGKGVSFQYAWRVSKGHTAYLCGVMLLISLSLMVVILPITLLTSSLLLLGVIGQIAGIVMIISLSLAYTHVVKEQQK
ncbi:hypothetical protein ACFFUP_17865 [Vibrio ostreicida]|uniref:hypothetical protein n=1 Tax=Vibrio ostreicida TaxID=526588 RepID=UPI001482F6B6|nr:hypothetical protein [Vibrio ostreicida]NPD09325.1 hypothetical protein [Vibrio ostreicida]